MDFNSYYSELYPDGSLDGYDVATSSWGIAVLDASYAGQVKFRGALRGQLVPSCPIYSDGDFVSSTTTEMVGILWGLLWVMTSADLPVCIYSDNSSAIGIAKRVAIPHADRELGLLLAAVFAWVSSRKDVTLSHVKGRAAFSGNELADGIADASRTEGLSSHLA